MIGKLKGHGWITMVILVGFLLRFWGVWFGLPFLYHADEPIVVNHALAYGSGDMNPHFFKIPPLVSYLLFLSYGVSFVIGKATGILKTVEDFQFLFLRNPTFFYFLARFIFGVLLGTASVMALHRLLTRFFTRDLALMASFLFAVAFLHVRDSHYVYLDIPLIFVMILAFFPILHIAEGERSLRIHFCAGFLIGFAVSIKYNGIMLVVPYLFACVLSGNFISSFKYSCLAAASSFLAYFITNPFSLLDFSAFWLEISQQAKAEEKIGWLHHFVYSLNGGVGPFILGSAVLAILVSLLIKEKRRWTLLSFLISYYVLLVFKSQRYDRYALPLVPFLLIFSADFLLGIGKKISPRFRTGFLTLSLFLIASPSIAKCILVDLILSRMDLRTEVKNWVESFIPTGKRLALDGAFLMPRLSFSLDQLEEKVEKAQKDPHFSEIKLKRLQFLKSQEEKEKKGYALYFLSQEVDERNAFSFSYPRIPYELTELKKHGIDFVLIARQEETYHPENFYEELKKNARLVKKISPYRTGREFPMGDQPLTGAPFLWQDLIERDRNGQPIEVYQL